MPTAKKAPSRSTRSAPAKRPSVAKGAASGTAKKAAPKTTAAKKAAPKTTAAKKAAPKKAATKVAPKKAAARTTAPKKSAPKAAAPKKAAGKAAPKKAAPKAAAPKAAAPKKAAPKAAAPKATAPKATAPKATAPKATAKKAPAKARRSPFDAKFLDAQRESLIEERATLEEQASVLKAEADALTFDREPGDVQFDDESGEGDTLAVERDFDLARAASARHTIEEIDFALERIKKGTYGICEYSGQAIPRERLKAIPWARERVEFKTAAFR